MYVVNVAPLTKIPHPNPQTLSYFCSEKIPVGGMVKISIRNKKIKAIVLEQKTLEQEKIRLKKFADYTIKPIEKIISKEPILTKEQLKLLFWFAKYYFTPLGPAAKIFISKKSSFVPTDVGTSEDKPHPIITPKTKGLVFGSFESLKSITIEDESSDLYRSWSRKPYYDVRTIAKQLAKIHKAKLILKNEFQNSKLKIQSSLVDMRKEIKNGNFSIISNELQEKLKKHKKSILFISRRGTSTFILCRECGYVSMCSKCDVPMIFHEDLRPTSKSLLCHHCGKQDIAPVLCPKCKSIKIKYFGAGTQKVESEVKKLIPNKLILRLDSDAAKKPEQQSKIIEKFKNNKNVVLIGTQMILNKEIKADMTAIISIDVILNLPDFKSSERVFKTIHQLRKMSKKEFLIQTYNPENYAIQTALANNYKKFYNNEVKMRKQFNYPPFSQIIKLTFKHKDYQKAKNEVEILLEKLKQQIKNLKFKADSLQLLGPTPAFIPRIAQNYRWNLIIKNKIKNLKSRNRLLMIVPSKWEIEVDPDSLL